MPKNIRHACRFLAGNDKIAVLLGVIERNEMLLDDVRRQLPPPLDLHCLHATFDAEVLILTTDSPVWASRLRFFAPELIGNLYAHSRHIASCRIRIQPPTAASNRGTAPKYKLSPSTKQHLLDAAAGIDDDELAAALFRLAKTGSARG